MWALEKYLVLVDYFLGHLEKGIMIIGDTTIK
jgi:hypothetical protein